MSDYPKDVEYYAAMVNAWLNTKFEHDKSLLTLSAGGIGLLITLVSTTGVKSIESLIVYILAIVAFLVCLGVLLWIFRRNAKHLEDVVLGTKSSDPLLAFLDNVAISSFLLGVLFSSIIGVSTAFYSYQEERHKMADIKKLGIGESINGIAKMAPEGKNVKLSFEGIAKMNPSNAAPATPAPTPPPTTSSSEKK